MVYSPVGLMLKYRDCYYTHMHITIFFIQVAELGIETVSESCAKTEVVDVKTEAVDVKTEVVDDDAEQTGNQMSNDMISDSANSSLCQQRTPQTQRPSNRVIRIPVCKIKIGAVCSSRVILPRAGAG